MRCGQNLCREKLRGQKLLAGNGAGRSQWKRMKKGLKEELRGKTGSMTSR
jgi:hypothetical protein